MTCPFRVIAEPCGPVYRVVLVDDFGLERYEEVALSRERAETRAFEFRDAISVPASVVVR